MDWWPIQARLGCRKSYATSCYPPIAWFNPLYRVKLINLRSSERKRTQNSLTVTWYSWLNLKQTETNAEILHKLLFVETYKIAHAIEIRVSAVELLNEDMPKNSFRKYLMLELFHWNVGKIKLKRTEKSLIITIDQIVFHLNYRQKTLKIISI